jgi:hypothetical protein
MRRVLPFVALVALLAATAASAASARTTKLTKAENTWAVPVVSLMKSMSGRVGAIGKQAADPQVLTKGSKAQLKLAVTLANLLSCTGKLKKDGPPPTSRLKPFASSVKAACTHYVAGSHLLAKGIGKVNATMIKQAMTEIKTGSASLATAQSRLVKLTR